jgi:ganglioside GM2 activator
MTAFKYCCMLILLATSSWAFTQPRVIVKGLAQCPGYENAPLQVTGGTVLDEIPIPGDVPLDIESVIKSDLPNDLKIALKLVKQDPFPLEVPCLDGLGSCEYDICSIILNLEDTLCPAFPVGQPCSCPLMAGDFTISGAKIPVPDFGPILSALMVGRYKAKAELYGASDPDNKVGCIDFEFKFVHG